MPELAGFGAPGLALLGAALLGAALGGLTLGVNVWMTRQSVPYSFSDPASVPPRPIAIVPGARGEDLDTPSAALEDRLLAALALYRAGRVERILASGDGRGAEVDQGEVMRRLLERHDVPAEDVILDADGLRTILTMSRARAVYGVDAAIVCTQAFHLPRSVWLARRQGIDAVGLSADRRVYRSAWIDGGREALARVKAWVEVGWP